MPWYDKHEITPITFKVDVICLKWQRVQIGEEQGDMNIRFVTEEDGILYMVTNYRQLKGEIQYATGKCWKFPLSKTANN